MQGLGETTSSAPDTLKLLMSLGLFQGDNDAKEDNKKEKTPEAKANDEIMELFRSLA